MFAQAEGELADQDGTGASGKVDDNYDGQPAPAQLTGEIAAAHVAAAVAAQVYAAEGPTHKVGNRGCADQISGCPQRDEERQRLDEHGRANVY